MPHTDAAKAVLTRRPDIAAADLEDLVRWLPAGVAAARRLTGLSIRQVAAAAGLRTNSTVHRAEQGRPLALDNVIALLRWIEEVADRA